MSKESNFNINSIILNSSSPQRIKSVNRKPKGFAYTVEWNKSQCTQVSSSYLRENYPNLLIDFLESKVRIIN